MIAARQQLHRVMRSDVFRHSDALRHLLDYLGSKSFSDPPEEVKEYTIGIEACGKPPEYDPQKDASVRVQVGRLRQKLEDYYKSEGRADPVVLELPKGRFALLVRQQPPESKAPVRRFRVFRNLNRVTVVLALLLAAALVWAGLLYQRVREYEGGLGASVQAATVREFIPLWGSFLSHNAPSVVVFGSPSFFASAKHNLFVRLYGLTDPDNPKSSPEFDTVDSRVGPLAGPRFDYASMGDAIAVQRLTSFFGSAGISLKALPAHLAAWESIKDNNLIFIGAWRMHPLLRRLPITQDFELGPDDQIHNQKPGPGELKIYTTPSHRDSMTYASVGVFPGLRPGREVFVVTAHSSPGAVGAVDFITNADSVKLMRDRIGLPSSGHRKYFQMLLRVYVDNDVPMKTEYVTHHLNPQPLR